MLNPVFKILARSYAVENSRHLSFTIVIYRKLTKFAKSGVRTLEDPTDFSAHISLFQSILLGEL